MDPRPWKRWFLDLLCNGFEDPFPTAKNKHGKVHRILYEGYPPSLVSWGDDYEEMVRLRGPSPATVRHRVYKLLLALLHANHPLVSKGCYHPIVVFRIVSYLPRWQLIVD